MRNIKAKFLKTNKGNAAIITLIKAMFLLIAFAVTFDLVLISMQYVEVSRQTNVLARQIAIQSGLESSTPKGFPGSGDAYTTTPEMLSKLNESKASENWKRFNFYVDGVKVSDGTESIKKEKGESIKVTLEVYYDWYLTRIFIPKAKDKMIRSTKTVFGEFDRWLAIS